MHTYQKVESMNVPAAHPVWGNVTVVSKWQNICGQILHRVRLDDDSIRYTNLSKGGAA